MSDHAAPFCTLPSPSAPENGDDGTGAVIYGREGCPHTARARKGLPRARFIDVTADPAALEEMLRLSGGVRRIPVIVRGEMVEIGFRRGA